MTETWCMPVCWHTNVVKGGKVLWEWNRVAVIITAGRWLRRTCCVANYCNYEDAGCWWVVCAFVCECECALYVLQQGRLSRGLAGRPEEGGGTSRDQPWPSHFILISISCQQSACSLIICYHRTHNTHTHTAINPPTQPAQTWPSFFKGN